MCGICVTERNKYNSSMKHRGLKTHKRMVGGLQLIHEHLPIQGFKEPIIETNRFTVLFNGELFHDDYSNDLKLIKDIFSSANDIEEAITDIKNIDGFYAFIVMDKIERQIVCFTDPLGKKQLYYSDFGISSEIRPHLLYRRKFDQSYFGTVLKFGYNTDDRTPYLGIKRIMPNCVYKFDYFYNLQHLKHNYYEFKKSFEGNLYDKIDKSVSNRLKGHESIGMLLSGGLDSSIIKHHIDKHSKNVNSYCVNNEEDIKYAKLLDKNVNIIELDMINNKALETMEMPVDLGSMYQQYALFKNVKETVILTGDGADEAFGGYKRMNDYDSQISDIFDELRFYHNIRLDRMSMAFTKECRSPFMSISVIEHAMSLDYEKRINKNFLRETYRSILPEEIIDRPKEPLKSSEIRLKNQFEYRSMLIERFKNNEAL